MINVPVGSGGRAAASLAEPPGPSAEPSVDPGRFERALAAGSSVTVERSLDVRLSSVSLSPRPASGNGGGTPGERVLSSLNGRSGSLGSARGARGTSANSASAAAGTPGSRVLDGVDRSRRRPSVEEDSGELASVAAEAGRSAEAGRAAAASATTQAGMTAESGAARAAAGAGAGRRSGLSWQTGFYNAEAGDHLPTLAGDESRFLGRGTDVFTSFWNHESRATMRQSLDGHFQRRFDEFAEHGIRVAQAVPLAAKEDAGRINEILNGSLRDDYVQMWRELGAAMARAGNDKPIVRLGWEMNLASGGYAWNQSNSSISPQQFAELYRLAADAIRSTKPDVVLCWNPGKVTGGSHHIDEWYPGSEYVDIIGVDFYDNGTGGMPHFENDRVWAENFMRTGKNGPIGLGAWYEYAKDKGELFAVPEWGLTNGKDGQWHNDLDRPEFIENMYKFFQMAASEGNLVFENYFNSPDKHQIYPVLEYHQSSSYTYRELFQAGGTVPDVDWSPWMPSGPDRTPSGGGGGRPSPGTGPTGPIDRADYTDDAEFALALFMQAFPRMFIANMPPVWDEDS